MLEAGVVVAVDGAPLHWHLPPDRSVAYLPDSVSLWDVLWDNRSMVKGFAHSHPGSGMPYPSGTDISTFEALESGLGKRLDWWITSSDTVILLRWCSETKAYTGEVVDGDLPWLSALRERSVY